MAASTLFPPQLLVGILLAFVYLGAPAERRFSVLSGGPEFRMDSQIIYRFPSPPEHLTCV